MSLSLLIVSDYKSSCAFIWMVLAFACFSWSSYFHHSGSQQNWGQMCVNIKKPWLILLLFLSLDINARRKVGHQGQSLVTFCDFACCSHAGSISDLSLSLSLSVSVLKILTFKAKCLCIPLQISETLCAACLFPTLIITKWGFLAQFLFGLFSPAGLLIYLSIYPHFLVLKWQVKNIKWKSYTH